MFKTGDPVMYRDHNGKLWKDCRMAQYYGLTCAITVFEGFTHHIAGKSYVWRGIKTSQLVGLNKLRGAEKRMWARHKAEARADKKAGRERAAANSVFKYLPDKIILEV